VKYADEKRDQRDRQYQPVLPLGRGYGSDEALAKVVVDEEHRRRTSFRARDLEIRFETQYIKVDKGPKGRKDEGDGDGDIVVGERLRIANVIGILKEDESAVSVAILSEGFEDYQEKEHNTGDKGKIGGTEGDGAPSGRTRRSVMLRRTGLAGGPVAVLEKDL
jgi:hypothetical protein